MTTNRYRVVKSEDWRGRTVWHIIETATDDWVDTFLTRTEAREALKEMAA